MGRWTNGQMDKQTDERMDKWTDGQMDKWVDKVVALVQQPNDPVLLGRVSQVHLSHGRIEIKIVVVKT